MSDSPISRAKRANDFHAGTELRPDTKASMQTKREDSEKALASLKFQVNFGKLSTGNPPKLIEQTEIWKTTSTASAALDMSPLRRHSGLRCCA
jgi:ribosomal protein L29